MQEISEWIGADWNAKELGVKEERWELNGPESEPRLRGEQIFNFLQSFYSKFIIMKLEYR